MNLISCDNHTIRKALSLSMNEMGVLVDIVNLSSNPKTSFVCIKSKRKMAEWLDLSMDTIFTILKSLEKKGYIERGEKGCKPTQFIYDIKNCQEEIGIYLKSGDTELITMKIKQIMDAVSVGIGKSDTNEISDVDVSGIQIGVSGKPIVVIGNSDSHLNSNITHKLTNTPISPSGTSCSFYNEYLQVINKILNRDFRGGDKVRKQLSAREKEGYCLEDFSKAIFSASKQQFHIEKNFSHLTAEFFTRTDKLEAHLNGFKALHPLQKEEYEKLMRVEKPVQYDEDGDEILDF